MTLTSGVVLLFFLMDPLGNVPHSSSSHSGWQGCRVGPSPPIPPLPCPVAGLAIPKGLHVSLHSPRQDDRSSRRRARPRYVGRQSVVAIFGSMAKRVCCVEWRSARWKIPDRFGAARITSGVTAYTTAFGCPAVLVDQGWKDETGGQTNH